MMKNEKIEMKDLTQIQYNMIYTLIERNPNWQIDEYVKFINEFRIVEASTYDIKQIVKAIGFLVEENNSSQQLND